jgi:hypothetical protein
VPYAIEKHKERADLNDLSFFQVNVDLFVITIRQGNEKIGYSLSDFFYEEFKSYRESSANKEVVYPLPYYDFVSKIIEESASIQSNRLRFIAHRAAGGVWLLGEYSNSKISQTTYQWLWSNIKLSLKYNRTDFVEMFWENSHNFKQFIKRQPNPILHPDTFEIINNYEIDLAKKEIDTFVRFHYFLGGLLMYKEQYGLINKFFINTNEVSFPVLKPKSPSKSVTERVIIGISGLPNVTPLGTLFGLTDTNFIWGAVVYLSLLQLTAIKLMMKIIIGLRIFVKLFIKFTNTN